MVRLLGRPSIERGGVVVAGLRGRTVWGVIACLVLAEQRVSRARLVS